MPSDRWSRIDAIFAGALTLPLGQRADYVARACGGDEALREEVEELLDAAASAESWFDEQLEPRVARVGAGAGAEALDDALPEEARLGAYRLLRLLGRGGMGAVYLAERADGQFERRVAIKVIRPGVGGKDVVRRFLRERRILARLQHPSIARLYDGGLTPDGRPYIVMEHVEGVPITEYCEREALGLEARLRLFQEVARAVQHAHRNLVLHRDLKPSNILVTAEGAPKLLDFGIGKILEEEGEGAEQAGVTRTVTRVMTPAYAAPEQVRCEAVTTATDVYALGVLLYEMLTGRRPIGRAGDTPEEMADAVVAETPLAPSDALREERERGRSATGSGEEDATPGAPRRLPEDLDRICLMALRKEPERRYASAAAFSDDVQRHLDGLPVVARPDTLGYRLRKFVGRHRAGVAAAAVVLLSLVGGLGAALWQAGIASREAVKAEEVSTFLAGLFRVSDPGESRGERVTARELLDRGAERIGRELAGQPAVQAEMMNLVGGLYDQLGLFDRAEPLIESALAVRRELHGEEHLDVAESLASLASLRYEQGEYEEAESLYGRALRIRRSALGEDDLTVAATENGLGLVLAQKGDYEEAIALHRRSLETRRARLDGDHREVANSLNDLALALKWSGDFDAAEPLYREALAMRRRVLGEDHPEVANTIDNLAILLAQRGDHEAAAPLFRGALEIRQRVLGEGHPDVAMSKNNLASLYYVRGDFDAAEPLYREVLEANRALLGEEHPRVATNLNNLAATFANRGRYEEAARLHARALEIRRAALGPEHRATAQSLYQLATARRGLGDAAGADSLYRAALARTRTALGREHPQVAVVLHGWGGAMLDGARPAEAEPLLREALAIRETALDEGHWETAATRALLGEALAALGRNDAARPLLEAGVETLRAERPGGDPTLARAEAALAGLREAGS